MSHSPPPGGTALVVPWAWTHGGDPARVLRRVWGRTGEFLNPIEVMMRLRKLILVGAVALLGTTAEAGPLARLFGGRQCQPAPQSYAAPTGGVQAKADAQARAGRCFHPGGGFAPGASYEGVGYSSASPQDALNHCCNNGGPVVAQAVSRGPGGWYAVKQYASPGPVRQAVGGAMVGAGQVVANVGAAMQQPLVRTTSYDGIGVPVDATVYQPIRLGGLLPTSCGPGGCR